MGRIGQFAQYIDREEDVLSATVELPDLEANDELSFMDRLRQVDSAVIVDRAKQAFGGVVGVFTVGGVLEREERKVAVRCQVKAVQRCDRGGGLLSPGNMVPDALSEVFETVGTEQEPELEGAESAPQGDRPFAVIGDFGLAEGLEVIRTDAEGANLWFRVGTETGSSSRTVHRATCGD